MPIGAMGGYMGPAGYGGYMGPPMQQGFQQPPMQGQGFGPRPFMQGPPGPKRNMRKKNQQQRKNQQRKPKKKGNADAVPTAFSQSYSLLKGFAADPSISKTEEEK